MRIASSRLRIFLGALAAATVTAAALISISAVTRHGSGDVDARSPRVPADTLFAGIPQHGNVLGSTRAPVTVVEYADLQCPYCGEFARMALPSLVRTYVRPGKVRLVFRGLAFVGPDSESALRAVVAAGRQDRLWDLAHVIYVNQGTENTGWVTDGFLRTMAGSVGALDVPRVMSDARSTATTNELLDLATLARRDGVRGTPTFLAGRTGGTLTPLRVRSLDASAFGPALDRLLAS